MADDLGYGELGCYGQKIIKTPRIDELARDGIRFTDFHCGAPVCAPSRCVLMTGKHSGHAAIRNNRQVNKLFPELRKEYGWEEPGQQPLPEEEVTVAELLKAKGYATGAIGKWGLGMCGTTRRSKSTRVRFVLRLLVPSARAQSLSKISVAQRQKRAAYRQRRLGHGPDPFAGQVHRRGGQVYRRTQGRTVLLVSAVYHPAPFHSGAR